MKIISYWFLLFMIFLSIISCSTDKINGQTNNLPIDFSGPPTIIYKTKNDCSIYVPVTLSEDKSKIISYPSPKDIYYKEKLSYPTKLKKGYFLDNRGININSVFINITYEEYSKLSSAPPLNELYFKIIDKNPFYEFYNCGNRLKFKNEIKEINKLIRKKKLKGCKCLIEQK